MAALYRRLLFAHPLRTGDALQLSAPSWLAPRRGPQRGDKRAALALAGGATFACGYLAAAWVTSRARPQDLPFVTLDARLAGAALREGFPVLPDPGEA